MAWTHWLTPCWCFLVSLKLTQKLLLWECCRTRRWWQSDVGKMKWALSWFSCAGLWLLCAFCATCQLFARQPSLLFQYIFHCLPNHQPCILRSSSIVLETVGKPDLFLPLYYSPTFLDALAGSMDGRRFCWTRQDVSNIILSLDQGFVNFSVKEHLCLYCTAVGSSSGLEAVMPTGH